MDVYIGKKVKFQYKGEILEGYVRSIYNNGDTVNITVDKSAYTYPVCLLAKNNQEIKEKKGEQLSMKFE
ncbi:MULTISPECIES: hypothetical protein [Clostridium]|uniref:hypothetical protein n=1 Tax=Clostridium TaxID=1485 RepID=UPI00069DF15F|nr:MULTISPECIES: hypothetical protein [Clostridium]KOF57842.1 hypothetical protein AGR56_16700 [Clostridium sp. DMHC 10]MCD2345071.1 hypothetical protein [Clostridium guangxiense]